MKLRIPDSASAEGILFHDYEVLPTYDTSFQVSFPVNFRIRAVSLGPSAQHREQSQPCNEAASAKGARGTTTENKISTITGRRGTF